jgi:hypothetical protein
MYQGSSRRRYGRRSAIALLAVLTLGGCAGSAIETASAPPAGAVAAVNRSARQCEDDVGARSEYLPLRAKLHPEAAGHVARANPGNPRRPTPSETKLLDALNIDLRGCRSIALAEAPAARVGKLTESHMAVEKLWAEAVAGRLSWDQFNRQRKAIADRERAPLSDSADAVAAAPRTQDRFSLDHRDIRPGYRDTGQLYVRNPTVSISGPTDSPNAYCGVMSSASYCGSR